MENLKRIVTELENVRKGREVWKARECQGSEKLGKTARNKTMEEGHRELV